MASDAWPEDIPIWVDGAQKWMTGLTRRTTCDDVIYALLHARGSLETDSTDNYAVFERWRAVERPLQGRTKIVKVWEAWGAEQPNVHLLVQRLDDYFIPPDTSRARRRQRHARHRARHHGNNRCRCSGRPQCAKCSRLKAVEQLVKHLVKQERQLQDLKQRVQVTDRQIALHEARQHARRVQRNGRDYVQQSYLFQHSHASSDNISNSSTCSSVDSVDSVLLAVGEDSLDEYLDLCDGLYQVLARLGQVQSQQASLEREIEGVASGNWRFRREGVASGDCRHQEVVAPENCRLQEGVASGNFRHREGVASGNCLLQGGVASMNSRQGGVTYGTEAGPHDDGDPMEAVRVSLTRVVAASILQQQQEMDLAREMQQWDAKVKDRSVTLVTLQQLAQGQGQDDHDPQKVVSSTEVGRGVMVDAYSYRVSESNAYSVHGANYTTIREQSRRLDESVWREKRKPISSTSSLQDDVSTSRLCVTRVHDSPVANTDSNVRTDASGKELRIKAKETEGQRPYEANQGRPFSDYRPSTSDSMIPSISDHRSVPGQTINMQHSPRIVLDQNSDSVERRQECFDNEKQLTKIETFNRFTHDSSSSYGYEANLSHRDFRPSEKVNCDASFQTFKTHERGFESRNDSMFPPDYTNPEASSDRDPVSVSCKSNRFRGPLGDGSCMFPLTYDRPCSRLPDSCSRLPDSCSRLPDSCSRLPDSCSRLPDSQFDPYSLCKDDSGVCSSDSSTDSGLLLFDAADTAEGLRDPGTGRGVDAEREDRGNSVVYGRSTRVQGFKFETTELSNVKGQRSFDDCKAELSECSSSKRQYPFENRNAEPNEIPNSKPQHLLGGCRAETSELQDFKDQHQFRDALAETTGLPSIRSGRQFLDSEADRSETTNNHGQRIFENRREGELFPKRSSDSSDGYQDSVPVILTSSNKAAASNTTTAVAKSHPVSIISSGQNKARANSGSAPVKTVRFADEMTSWTWCDDADSSDDTGLSSLHDDDALETLV